MGKRGGLALCGMGRQLGACKQVKGLHCRVPRWMGKQWRACTVLCGQAMAGLGMGKQLRACVAWCHGVWASSGGLHCVVWTGSCHWGPVYGQAGWGLALCGTMALGRAMVGLHWVVWTGSCGPVWASSGGLALCGTREPGYGQAGQGLALRGIML